MVSGGLTVFEDVEQGKDWARFLKFVQESDPTKCWEWLGNRHPRGYGRFWFNGKKEGAHRVAYQLSSGHSITPGLLVRHSCDNPPCVNPRHLLLGTVQDNSDDAVERGRMPAGSENGRAKLNDRDVKEIRSLWTSGVTQVAMAKHFGVSRAAIQWILNGRNWSKVSGA